MNSEKELSKLTDEELLQAAKKMKLSAIIFALLIGGVFGIIVYGVAKKNIGYFGFIVLVFLVYRFFYNPENRKRNEALKRECSKKCVKEIFLKLTKILKT